MGTFQREKYEQWLRKNTKLAEGTIRLYGRTAQYYLKHYRRISTESLNKFVSRGFRDVHANYLKFAMRYFLRYAKKSELYMTIVAVKEQPRKKTGRYVSDSIIRKIIMNIKDPMYQDIALLQWATGARAREILTLRAENITKDHDSKNIKLRLIGKGGRERPSFLQNKYKYALKKYVRASAGFLFMEELYALESDRVVNRKIDTMRTKYYEQLRASAQSLGLPGFGTHDFRRNVAERIRREFKDPYTVKRVLGHQNINTTLKYFDEAGDDVQEAIISHQGER